MTPRLPKRKIVVEGPNHIADVLKKVSAEIEAAQKERSYERAKEAFDRFRDGMPLTARQVSLVLGCVTRSVHAWTQRGELVRKWNLPAGYDPEDVRAFMDRRRCKHGEVNSSDQAHSVAAEAT